MAAYRSGKNPATYAIVLVALQMALGLVTVVACLQMLGSNVPAYWFTRYATQIEVASALMYLGALANFMRWVYRAVGNLEALGSQSCRLSPGSAVWAFFIPIINLFRPYEVMKHIWVESQQGGATPEGYPLRAKTDIVTAWWGMVWISTILERLPRLLETARADAAQLFTFAIVLSVSWCITGILFIRMLGRAQARQDAQWADLELRRQMPVPTADQLR